MAVVRANNEVIAVNAYVGDAKSLLAFDLINDAARSGLAGFTIEVHPPGGDPYFVDNNLRLAADPDSILALGRVRRRDPDRGHRDHALGDG